MPNKSPKDERNQSSSSDGTMPTAEAKNTSDTAADEISTEKMEAILMRARQTVKPIIKREATNEVVSEDILDFRMAHT